MMVFMPLVVILIGQFCREVISREDLKVAVIGWKRFVRKIVLVKKKPFY